MHTAIATIIIPSRVMSIENAVKFSTIVYLRTINIVSTYKAAAAYK